MEWGELREECMWPWDYQNAKGEEVTMTQIILKVELYLMTVTGKTSLISELR